MRPPEEVAPPANDARRLSGPRFVVGLLGAPVVVAVIVILIGVIVIANRDEDEACGQEPAVCATVRDYAAAFNARDASGLSQVVTSHGLRTLLDAASEEELAQRLQLLSSADRIEGVEVTRVSIEDDRALAVALYTQRDEEFNAVYQLVRQDGRWLIDR